MKTNKLDANRIKLYATALSFLGTDASPKDEAPDDLACAESVSKVINTAFPNCIKGSVSTAELFNQLDNSKDFYRVLEFKAGDVIISPTGKGNGKIPNGHVGIISEFEEIMSNSSATGTWEANFTIKSWVERYRTKGGYPIYSFRKS